MAQELLKTTSAERIKFGAAGAIALAFLLAVVSWGGVAPGGDSLPAFWLGVAVLVAVLCGFAFACWRLLVRPLPGQAPAAQPIPAGRRQAIALLLAIAGASIVIGGFWDELWHRRYGIPFGEDFFWRPHLLMYFGFLVVVALGFVGLAIIARREEGTLQQRFRADPVVGLLVLVAAFLLYVLPADPIWHGIYGADLTAWSIPHLLLILSFTTIMLVAAAIQLSTTPLRQWRSLARITAHDLLPLLMVACILLVCLQLFTTEYDIPSSFNNRVVQARPDWVLPFMVVAVAAFTGTLTNHSLRIFGGATAAGLAALGLRYALIQLFDAAAGGPLLRTSGWMLALPPLLAIDLWYGYYVLRQRTRRLLPAWVGGGVAGAAGMLAGYPLLTQLYPHVVIANLPLMAVMVLAASVSASWLGAQLGDYVGTSNKQVEDAATGSLLPLALLGVTAATVAFIVFFVTTATPPV